MSKVEENKDFSKRRWHATGSNSRRGGYAKMLGKALDN